ncbi:tyrosine-protein phosphatase [Streptomyces sp. NPDC014734]|uniref:tyrosine-protein phosphatase n=1 Tax=Streptomyces sp. NPDC014734 TaxID=3364886 RepID=UPI0036FAD4B4
MTLLNFRDPATSAHPGGDRIRAGILFRSAQPFPSAAGGVVESLRAKGVATVVDLRGAAERSADDWAAARAAGIRVVRAPLDAEDDDAIAGPGIGSLRTAADLGLFYVALARSAPRAVADAVRAAAAPGATLLHCAAGKDRTGLLVALLLDLAGLPAEGIVADYARTAEALPQVFAALAAHRGIALNAGPTSADGGAAPDTAVRAASPHGAPVLRGEPGRTVPAPLLQAPPEAMRVFLETVRANHGGAEGFLLSCGVEDDAVAAFRAKASPAVPAADGAFATAVTTPAH